MGKLLEFEQALDGLPELDFQGYAIDSPEMYRQYQRRNNFGLGRDRRIHRIFQKKYLEDDIANQRLTLPRANATIWKDPLENPLADVEDIDVVTGQPINLGSLLRNFFALCWTRREFPKSEDWASFSHGSEVVRISTTVGKIMDRVMSITDSQFMFRGWIIGVEYKEPHLIQAMQNPSEVYARMDSQGSLLAIAAATVRSQFSCEDEVRLLYDPSFNNGPTTSRVIGNGDLLQIPCDWTDFIDEQVCGP